MYIHIYAIQHQRETRLGRAKIHIYVFVYTYIYVYTHIYVYTYIRDTAPTRDETWAR